MGAQCLRFTINEFYGQTECPVAANVLTDARSAGLLGRAVPGHEVAILMAETAARWRTGIIAIRRPDPVMLGYWNNTAATAAKFNGDWLLTGDSGDDSDGPTGLRNDESPSIPADTGSGRRNRRLPASASFRRHGGGDRSSGVLRTEAVTAVIVPSSRPIVRAGPRDCNLSAPPPHNRAGSFSPRPANDGDRQGDAGDAVTGFAGGAEPADP